MSTEPTNTDGDAASTPYIRTFAKDYAALSGKQPDLKSANLESKKHTSKKKKRKKGVPDLSESNEPFITETPQTYGPVNLSELEKEADKVDAPPKNALQELSAETAPPAPPELPHFNPGNTIIPEPIQQTDERASILARLKSRAQSTAELGPNLRPITPTPQATDLASVEEPSPLHTYSSDFVDHVAQEQATPFAILAAEKDAAPVPVKEAPPKKKSSRGTFAVIAGMFLILIGVGAVYAAYNYMEKNAPVLGTPFAPSLITPDSRVVLSGTGNELLQALAQQANQPLTDNSIALTYVNQATTTAQGIVEEPASGGALITELNLGAPDILLRNIDPSSMVGIVSANGETHPFFILRVTSYERTFSGMLAWEPALYAELSLLYPEYPAPVTPPAPVNTATTSSTHATSTVGIAAATPQVQSNANVPASQFIDETVASHDIRALKDNAGRTLVLYGYADKETLIIARNEAAFTVLLGRLTSGTN